MMNNLFKNQAKNVPLLRILFYCRVIELVVQGLFAAILDSGLSIIGWTYNYKV